MHWKYQIIADNKLIFFFFQRLNEQFSDSIICRDLFLKSLLIWGDCISFHVKCLVLLWQSILSLKLINESQSFEIFHQFQQYSLLFFTNLIFYWESYWNFPSINKGFLSLHPGFLPTANKNNTFLVIFLILSLRFKNFIFEMFYLISPVPREAKFFHFLFHFHYFY